MKKYSKIIQQSISALLLVLLLFSCIENNYDYNKPDYVKEGSLMEVLSKNANYSKFCELLIQTGYDSVLYRGDLFTVLAIDNAELSGAFLPADRAELKKVLGMHILSLIHI